MPPGPAVRSTSSPTCASRCSPMAGTQYAAYYDADGYMVLARRAVGTDDWERRRTTSRGNVSDAHNSISIAVDGDGFLHVAWDHHVNALNYARGVAPGTLELGPRQPMTGTREERVTYPQFWRLPGGDVLVPVPRRRVGPRVAGAQPVLGGVARVDDRPAEPGRRRRRAQPVLGHGGRPRRRAASRPGSGATRPTSPPTTTSATPGPPTRGARGRAATARHSRCRSLQPRRSTPHGFPRTAT